MPIAALKVVKLKDLSKRPPVDRCFQPTDERWLTRAEGC